MFRFVLETLSKRAVCKLKLWQQRNLFFRRFPILKLTPNISIPNFTVIPWQHKYCPGLLSLQIYKLYDWLKFSFKFAELHCYIFVNLWYSILEITYFISIFITVFNCQMILVSLHNICQPRPGLSFCFNKKAKRLSTLMFLPERNKKNPGKASVF